MSPITNKYAAHASNFKRAIRNASERLQEVREEGREVTVLTTGLTSIAPPRSGLVSQVEKAVDLNAANLVLLLDLVQIGVPCTDDSNKFFAMNGTEFVIWITQDAADDDVAFDILEPYYRAIMNLP
jgi:hypothetical protein